MTPPDRGEWHYGKRHIDANRIVRELGLSMVAVIAGMDLIDYTEVSPDVAATALGRLSDGLSTLRRVVRQLEQVAGPVTVTDGEPCRHCGRPVTPSESGRVRLYCSRSCRQRAYEQRLADITRTTD